MESINISWLNVIGVPGTPLYTLQCRPGCQLERLLCSVGGQCYLMASPRVGDTHPLPMKKLRLTWMEGHAQSYSVVVQGHEPSFSDL